MVVLPERLMFEFEGVELAEADGDADGDRLPAQLLDVDGEPLPVDDDEELPDGSNDSEAISDALDVSVGLRVCATDVVTSGETDSEPLPEALAVPAADVLAVGDSDDVADRLTDADAVWLAATLPLSVAEAEIEGVAVKDGDFDSVDDGEEEPV